MKTVIEMAREAGFMRHEDSFYTNHRYGDCKLELERFAELVRADEREAAYKRRGVLMFNPYSGTPRHPSDIQSDPHAILLLDPEQPIRARGETK